MYSMVRCGMTVAIAVLMSAALARGQVAFYTGTSQIGVSDGLLTFSDITQNGRSLRNYVDQDLIVDVQGSSFVFTPCGFNNENIYYASGGGAGRITITRIDGRDFDTIEMLTSTGRNDCTVYLWVAAFLDDSLVDEFDADLPGGTLVGLRGTFDKVEIGAYANAVIRDEHNRGYLNYLAIDDMEYGRAGGGGYQLTVSGQCPGAVTVSWSGADPGSQQALVIGQNVGQTTIPNNQPCPGTVLGIQGQVQLVSPPGFFGTGNGSGSINGNAGAGACGRHLQLVHGGTCVTSNVEQIP